MNSKIRVYFTKIFLTYVLRCPFFPSSIRRKVLIVCGAKIGKKTFIGMNVYFDGVRTQNIEIGNYCTIKQNVSILKLFFCTNRNMFFGKVFIGDNCFIGKNSIIIKPITIGSNCILGSGRVMNYIIPDNSFAAGVPCKVIKQVEK